MNIYFAASIRGGRALQSTYDEIVQHLKRAGHTVLTEHIALQDVETSERGMSDAEIYAQDTAWLR